MRTSIIWRSSRAFIIISSRANKASVRKGLKEVGFNIIFIKALLISNSAMFCASKLIILLRRRSSAWRETWILKDSFIT